MSNALTVARINIDNGKRVSSGFFIDAEHVVASCHGIYDVSPNPNTNIESIIIDRINDQEHQIELEILDSNPQEDWALLKLKGGPRPGVERGRDPDLVRGPWPRTRRAPQRFRDRRRVRASEKPGLRVPI